MYRRPIVSLIGNGDEITLDGVGSEFTLKPGMTGTGTAPREITFSELAGGGSMVRHRRNTNMDIMIPVDVFHGHGEDSYAKLEDSRRRLEHICTDQVEIRLQTKDGYRSAFGYLKDGLEGDFAKNVVNRYRMNLAPTFVCNDTWWYGEEHVLIQKVDAARKPFLTSFGGTATIPFFPVVLASSTVDGAYQLDIKGDAPAWPIWEVIGPGEDLLIENIDTGERVFIEGEFGEKVTIDTKLGDIYSDSFTRGELWDRVSRDSDLFPLTPRLNQIKITMVNARPDSEVRLKYRETWRAGH
ncbi:phage distal tail protein [Brevibacterium aurantiacum]|uniref:phage distal tail protein n=1 Tax=Brevibacterium aurantiacum TaxID=273384 RepID=UPI003F93E6B9